MIHSLGFRLLLACATIFFSNVARADVTAEDVRDAIARATRYLKSQQTVRGGWLERAGQPGGVSALCTLALLEAGEPVDSPAVEKALAYLRALGEPRATYTTALQTMVFCTASPDTDRLLIRRNAQWLADHQIPSGPRAGAWTYFSQVSPRTRGDNSNSQFALLGLHEAAEAGVEIDPEVWKRSYEYWQSCQYDFGPWGYYKAINEEPKAPPTGSMTCAGIAALMICQNALSDGDAKVVGDAVRCCGQQEENDRLALGLDWLGSKFTVNNNPGPSSGVGDISRAGLLYYLYGVERVGRLTGRRFIGGHDWYREGAAMLIEAQDKLSGYWKGLGHGEENPLIATSLALLFLSKGRRPVVMAKLQHGAGDDWDHHRNGVQNLTRDIERRWQRRLTWQTVDVRVATLEDLLESPVLFLSGSQALQLAADQRESLRDYVNQGGFLFVEASCGGANFDQSFRAMIGELFPESALRLLPADHPIWFAEQKIAAEHMPPLYGVSACCRTSIVYCPEDLSCYWELARPGRQSNYPQVVQDKIDARVAVGANVVAYATNRQLKDKLDRPQIQVADRTADANLRGTIKLAKLSHSGGADDAPHALSNLLEIVGSQVQLRLTTNHAMISPTDSAWFEYPVTFIHGRRDFRWNARERSAIATYLNRGGFIFGDAICASPQFAAAFRREILAALPAAEFVRIPDSHPLYSNEFGGYDISEVTLRDPQLRADNDPLKAKLTRVKPFLEGVEVDGRLAVVFSPYDISCAMENQASLECKGYIKTDAARLAVNLMMYALQQ